MASSAAGDSRRPPPAAASKERRNERVATVWSVVHEVAERRVLGSAEDRRAVRVLARGAKWEQLATPRRLESYVASHRASRGAADRAVGTLTSSRERGEKRDDDDASSSTSSSEEEEEEEEEETSAVFADAARIAKDVPRTFGVFKGRLRRRKRRTQKDEKKEESLDQWARRVSNQFSAWALPPPPTPENEEAIRARLSGRLERILNVGTLDCGPYAQGMNYVAAYVLVEVRRESLAYALYAYLITELHVGKLHGDTLAQLLLAFEHALRVNAPRLHSHLRSEGFDPQLYAVEWFSALFSLSTQPDLTGALLDLLFARFPDAVLRVAVGLLKLAEPEILALGGFEALLQGFKVTLRKMDPTQAIIAALSVRIPRDAEGDDSLARRQPDDHSSDDEQDDDADDSGDSADEQPSDGAASPTQTPRKRALRRPASGNGLSTLNRGALPLRDHPSLATAAPLATEEEEHQRCLEIIYDELFLC